MMVLDIISIKYFKQPPMLIIILTILASSLKYPKDNIIYLFVHPILVTFFKRIRIYGQVILSFYNQSYSIMGNDRSQPVVDPNVQQPSAKKQQSGSGGSQQQENQQMLQIIKEAFRNCAQHGQLTLDKFNQALSILEALGFKRLRDTPLADRLFQCFDKNNSGSIMESEFIEGITGIISDTENAIKYTFRAYDRDRDNAISRMEFMQFIEESWKAAFRLLSEGIDSKNMGVKIKNIQSWTASKTSLLNEQSSKLFNRISNGADRADYQAFRTYIMRGEVNDITAVLDNKTASVPLTLTKLH